VGVVAIGRLKASSSNDAHFSFSFLSFFFFLLKDEGRQLNYSETEARTSDIIGDQLVANGCSHIYWVVITSCSLVDTGHRLKSTAAEKGTATASPLH